MNEGQFSRRVLQALKFGQYDAVVWKNEAKIKHGFPDIACYYHGDGLFLELKSAPGNIASFVVMDRWIQKHVPPKQLSVLRRLNTNGFTAQLICTSTRGEKVFGYGFRSTAEAAPLQCLWEEKDAKSFIGKRLGHLVGPGMTIKETP